MIQALARATGLTLVLSLGLFTSVAHGNGVVAASKVYLNGAPYPVYFNDGDSFRVLAGPYAGTKARLAGYNTLESYGYTHSWGGWTARELYYNAKLGTYNARKGVWRCTSDLKRDGYGRILWWCPDLAEDQIRKGFAHAMSIRGPANAKLMDAQRDAIAHKRGMWAHGVPRYVVTSLHSAEELWFKGLPYNRMVSTKDGSSRKWRHQKRIPECEKMCWYDGTLDPESERAGLVALKGAASIQKWLPRYTDAQLKELLAAYATNGDLGVLKTDRSIKDNEQRYEKFGYQARAFGAVLSKIVADGMLKVTSKVKSSCMVHAAFNRRYGRGAASCLH